MEKKQKILIVDDISRNIQLAANILKEDGYDIYFTTNGKTAIEKLMERDFDLVLLDVMMPDMDGFEVCEELMKIEKTKNIPIIFLTAKAEEESVMKGFEIGAADYVTKPFNAGELRARVRNQLVLKSYKEEIENINSELKRKNEELIEKNSELKEAMERLEIMATTDPLTGLYNRRHMMNRIREEIARVKRNGRKFSIVIGDIDFFKKVNDTYGHDCGDYILKSVSNLMKYTAREKDFISRWGGEEFLIMLTETDLNGAREMAERVRSNIEEKLFEHSGKEIKITMTLGVAEFESIIGIDETINRADRSLYKGKHSGRNKVVCYEGEL